MRVREDVDEEHSWNTLWTIVEGKPTFFFVTQNDDF